MKGMSRIDVEHIAGLDQAAVNRRRKRSDHPGALVGKDREFAVRATATRRVIPTGTPPNRPAVD
jgi:hypothetical protein